jgi:putative peptidoglycan lipid II flippase
MFVARLFGSGSTLDAFYIALLLCSGTINIFGGSIGASLIPVYLEVKHHGGREAAKRLFGSIFALTTLLFVAFGIVLVLFSAPLITVLGSGFDAATRLLTSRLFLVLAPGIVLTGIPLTWIAILNAENHFAVPSSVRAVSPAVCIAILYLWPKESGIYSLAAGTLLGAMTEFVILAYALRQQGFSLIPRWYGFDADVRRVLRQFTPGITCSVWSSGAGIVDQSMAAALPSGSVASLNYGCSIVGTVLGVIGEALGTTMLPAFSRLVAERTWADVRRLLRNYVWLAFVTGTGAMLVLIALSHRLTALLYQRGAFSAANADLVGRIQIVFALQIPASLVSVIVLRLLAAMQRTWVRSIGGIGNLVLDVGLNYWFIRSMGVAGIALSTSLVVTISTIYLGFALRRELRLAERVSPRVAGVASA